MVRSESKVKVNIIPEMIYECRKCGLLRNNKITHKHGDVQTEKLIKDSLWVKTDG